jgi:hypothetical protein
MRAPQEVLDNNSTVQTKASSGHTPAVTPNVANGIQTLRVGGQPLPESTRSYFEPRFGHDFSQVRIHVDNRAAELASRINAKAFSFGEDVVFGSGQYQPHSHEGRRLLAHELTHVVQQAGGGVTVVQSAPPMVARQVGGRDPALLSDEELHREYNALRSFLLEADPNSLGYEELVRDVDRLEAEMLSPRPVPDERERVEGSMPPAPATGGGDCTTSWPGQRFVDRPAN